MHYGFRRGFNTQNTLLSLIDTCKKFLDIKQVTGALLLDLSKAFDIINHEPLTVRLIIDEIVMHVFHNS